MAHRLYRSFVVCSLLGCSSIAFAQSAPPSAAGLRVNANEARVTWTTGTVEVTTGVGPAAVTRPLAIGEVLQRGARVHTAEGAAAELQMHNDTMVELGERTQLMMFASPAPAAPNQAPSTTTTLQRGMLRVRMASGIGATNAELIPIATTAATSFVGRSDSIIAADLGGHITRLAVHRGRMRVRTLAREYILRAGNGSYEEFGRPPQPYRQLPSQPTWSTPPPARVISVGEPVDVTMAFRLRGVGVAAHWRVELARDEAFRDVVRHERIVGATSSWTAHNLEPGTYFARVVGIDQDRFEGPASDVARVVVAAPRVVSGRLADGTREARQARIEVPEGFYCGLDGAALLPAPSPIRLVPGRRHTLRCATSSEARDVREVTLSPEQSGPLVRDVRIRSVAFGEGVMAVRLYDAEGHEVPYADVTVSNDRGVVVETLREARERGVYNAAVHWPRNVRRARFRFTVNGVESFEQELAQE